VLVFFDVFDFRNPATNMIDTHAHLDFSEFDQDREEVITRFFEHGGKAIVNIGVDIERSKKSIALAEKHENIFAAVGMHPEFFAKEDWGNKGDWADDLKKLAGHKKVVAIGEIGLDYFSRSGEVVSAKQKQNQKNGFLAQIEIAKDSGLPVIVHCREAWDDLYDIIKTFNVGETPTLNVSNTRFVLHCYSGGKKDTGRFLKLPNVYFSFSGNITYPKPAERAKQF